MPVALLWSTQKGLFYMIKLSPRHTLAAVVPSLLPPKDIRAHLPSSFLFARFLQTSDSRTSTRSRSSHTRSPQAEAAGSARKEGVKVSRHPLPNFGHWTSDDDREKERRECSSPSLVRPPQLPAIASNKAWTWRLQDCQGYRKRSFRRGQFLTPFWSDLVVACFVSSPLRALLLLSQVRLVQKIDTGKIYAMKTLMKSEMFKKDQVRTFSHSL